MNKHLLYVISGILVLALVAAPLTQWFSKYRRADEDVFTDTGAAEVFAAVDAVPTATSADTAAVPTVAPVEKSLEDGFILKEHDGEIAVFYAGESEPGLLTGIPVSILRSTDRAALSEGIYVSSVDDVAALIEDLGS